MRRTFAKSTSMWFSCGLKDGVLVVVLTRR